MDLEVTETIQMLNSSNVLSSMLWLTSCLSKVMQVTAKLIMTNFYLMSATSQWQKYVWSVPTSVEKPIGVYIVVIAPPSLSNATQNVAVYMAGYLLLKVLVSDCDECSEQLILPRLSPPFQEMSFYTFVHEKTYKEGGSLVLQTLTMTNFIEHLETIFCAILKA